MAIKTIFNTNVEATAAIRRRLTQAIEEGPTADAQKAL